MTPRSAAGWFLIRLLRLWKAPDARSSNSASSALFRLQDLISSIQCPVVHGRWWWPVARRGPWPAAQVVAGQCGRAAITAALNQQQHGNSGSFGSPEFCCSAADCRTKNEVLITAYRGPRRLSALFPITVRRRRRSSSAAIAIIHNRNGMHVSIGHDGHGHRARTYHGHGATRSTQH
jgi:hypothetical protein